MSVCLLNGNSHRVWVQFFLYEFISEKDRGFTIISPYKPDYQNPFNSPNHWKAFPNIFLIPFRRGWALEVIPKRTLIILKIHTILLFFANQMGKTPLTHRNCKVSSKNVQGFRTLDYYLNKFALIDGKTQVNKRNKTQSDKKSTIDIKKPGEPPKIPHFQMPPIYEKNDFVPRCLRRSGRREIPLIPIDRALGFILS